MTIHHGDCVEVMAGMPEASIDAIVCDPPYGLEFMGKEWDRLDAGLPQENVWKGRRGGGGSKVSDDDSKPASRHHVAFGGSKAGFKRCTTCGKRAFSGSPCECAEPTWVIEYPEGPPSSMVRMGRWHEQWATAALRVAKPGAYLLAFGGTRTVHRMTVALEDAGWIIRDMLVWAYASGFPKSRALLKPAWEPIVMARKPGPLRDLDIDGCRIGFASDEDRDSGVWGDKGQDTGKHVAQIGSDGQTLGRGWAGTGSHHNPSGRWPANIVLTDPIFDGDTEGVVGGGETGKMPASYDRNVMPPDGSAWSKIYGGGDGIPVRDRAEGYGDTGTYSRFFSLPGGQGCYLCGRARTAPSPSSPSRPADASAPSPAPTAASSDSDTTTDSPPTSDTEMPFWPDASSSTSRTRRSRASKRGAPTLTSVPASSAAASGTSSDTTTTTADRWTCDTCVAAVMRSFMEGSESDEPRDYPRWYLIPKASRSDREPVMPGMLEERTAHMTMNSQPTGIGGTSRRNVHPTVKPIELMRHLVRLVTPAGGTVLDPFLGSGTTALAAEQEGRAWVGIEREAEYVRIAEARLAGNQQGMGLTG